MALGTPVLTSYCSSDARDMVGQGAALGFEVGDSSSLARHLAAILTDPGVGEALSRQAAVYIRTHTAEHAIAAYEQLIHDAIAKRSARVEG
jgi:glycosyltransferase involved in cell wall biosynthesis